MKPDIFLKAMGEIREDLVSDAETAGRTIPRWAKVSMAAVIVLCIAGALTMLLGQGVRPYGGQSLTSGSGVEEESSPENNFGISSEILEQAAPTVELTSRYGLTLQVSEELAGHFTVDVEDYVFPCPEEDGWADIAGGQDIIEHAAFVFSDPGNATGENGREGLIWCIQAIPAAEYTSVSNPDSEQDEPFMIYYINSRLLGRSEEYVYILVFPAPNWQYDPESLESLNAYWRHLYHGYEILQELAERYDWTDSMDWLDDYYERVVCLVDQERMKLTNQQTNSGVSDLDNDGLELAENVDNGVIELGGVRYKFYMAASPLFTPEYYEITVPSDFHVGEVVGYETDNTYDWYYAEVEPLSGWLIRYMRRNGDDKYSEGELYKAENITAIPQWIEDARKAIMENTGGYPGLQEGYTIIPDTDPPFQGSFGMTWDYVEVPRFPQRPVLLGYTESWTEEQIYAYASENLLSILDDYFEGGRERTTFGDHTVLLYLDGTVSSGVSFSYLTPHSDGSSYELLVVVNHDRMDEEMKARYLIGEPNNEIGGIPVWLGWTNADPNTDDGFVSTDYTLIAAFEYDGTYFFLRQNTAADGLFLGAIQSILEISDGG